MYFWIMNLITFGVSYLVIFILYLVFINRKKIKAGQISKITEIYYLVNKYNLDVKKIKYKKLLWIINIINPFIIAITFTVVTNFDKLIWSFAIGFLMLMILIFSIYEIIGRILKKRCEKDV